VEIGDMQRIYENLGVSSLHMRHLSKRDKRDIINRLEINGHVLATCLNVGRFQIINELHDKMRSESRIAKRKYIETQFDYVFSESIKSIYKSFLTSQGTILSDVIFEVDQDFRKPLSHLGLKRNAEAKFAYTIADVIANCNYTGKHISKVLEKNLFIGLKDSISRRLRL
jgi:hypothetical protein